MAGVYLLEVNNISQAADLEHELGLISPTHCLLQHSVFIPIALIA